MNQSNVGIQSLSGTAVPLDSANVDTDQIIPKQFLTSVSKAGFGKHLFHDWRYLDLHEKEPNPDFVLNKAEHKNASILLTRENFGCGSSREHAPWALTDYGFKVVIATSYADIFYGNCMNNELLPIALQPDEIDALFKAVQHDPSTEINIDLPSQSVECAGNRYTFNIEAHHKHNLIKGLDAIGQTLESSAAIQTFEQNIPSYLQ